MTQRSLIQVRVEESLRKDAEALFKELGLDMPSAVRLFLKQSLLQRGIPFAIVKPDDFYNEYNQQILTKSIEQLNAGTKEVDEKRFDKYIGFLKRETKSDEIIRELRDQ